MGSYFVCVYVLAKLDCWKAESFVWSLFWFSYIVCTFKGKLQKWSSSIFVVTSFIMTLYENVLSSYLCIYIRLVNSVLRLWSILLRLIATPTWQYNIVYIIITVSSVYYIRMVDIVLRFQSSDCWLENMLYK